MCIDSSQREWYVTDIQEGRLKQPDVLPPGLVEPTEEFIKQKAAMGQSVEITKTVLQ